MVIMKHLCIRFWSLRSGNTWHAGNKIERDVNKLIDSSVSLANLYQKKILQMQRNLQKERNKTQDLKHEIAKLSIKLQKQKRKNMNLLNMINMEKMDKKKQSERLEKIAILEAEILVLSKKIH